MKKLLVAISVVFMFTEVLDAQEPGNDLAFTERVFNFGTIEEKNGKVSHKFVFENKGKKPVTVNDVHSACGCIGRVTSARAVKPGEKGTVVITFDPSYKSGFFSKEIVVLSNNGQEYNRIWVEGKIIPTEHPIEDDYPYNFGEGLFLRLKVMAFGYVKPGETKQMELHYANSTDKEMSLSFTADKPGLRIINPGKIGPKEKGVIKVIYTMPFVNTNDVELNLRPAVNNKKLTESLEVRILNEVNYKQNKSSRP